MLFGLEGCVQSWRHDSATTSTCCSSGRPGFGSQNPHRAAHTFFRLLEQRQSCSTQTIKREHRYIKYNKQIVKHTVVLCAQPWSSPSGLTLDFVTLQNQVFQHRYIESPVLLL